MIIKLLIGFQKYHIKVKYNQKLHRKVGFYWFCRKYCFNKLKDSEIKTKRDKKLSMSYDMLAVDAQRKFKRNWKFSQLENKR